MGKRRSNHEGSIFKEKSTNLWVAEISLPDGSRRRKRSKNQSVVKEWLLIQRKALRDGIFITDDKYTISEFADRWFADVARHTLRPKTISSYEAIIRLHIKPEIGSIRLNQLRPDHLQSLYARKLESGLSKRTVQYIHALIHNILDTALKWGLAIRNVADSVSAPRPEKKLVQPLTPDQVQEFLEIIKNDRLYPLYVVLLGCGLRRGEALGMTTDCLDLDEGTIHVRKNLQWISGRGFVVGEPKSEKSRRDVAIPDFVLAVLKDHVKKSKIESEYIFCTANGTPFEPRNIIRHFKATLKKAGLPETTRLHDLRHTFVSYLLSQGTSPKDVQEIVGHSSFGVTMDIYGHLMPQAKKDAAKRINTLFEA